MNEYALVIDGAVTETRWYDERPQNIPHKKVEWFPVTVADGDGPLTLDRENDTVKRLVPPAVAQAPSVSSYRIVRRIEEAGKSVEADALLSRYTHLKFRFLTIGSVPCDDPDAAMLVKAIGLDPAVILAPEV